MKFQKGDNRFRMKQGMSPPKKKLPKAVQEKINATKKVSMIAEDLLIWGGPTTSTWRMIYTNPYGNVVPEDEEVIPEETEQTKQFKYKVMQLREVLNKKFINVDEIASILEIGFVTGKNVFLYGRGGHAKSEIMQEFLKYIDPDGDDSFVQACGEGLTEEKLFGGLNLKKFQETGEIEYLVEKSFMNKRYVVFEELLDSRMSVLLSLKDILQSGWFRQGSQQFKLRTEFIVVLTNRTKQEVAEDNSTKALLERFPLEYKVEWDSYTARDYSRMFEKVLGSSLQDIADICQTINENGDFVSPRTAIHMGEVFQKTGDLTNLKYFGATADIMHEVEKKRKRQEDARKVKEYRDKFNNITNTYPYSTTNEVKIIRQQYQHLIADLSNNSYCDAVYPDYTALKKEITERMEAVKQQLINQLFNE